MLVAAVALAIALRPAPLTGDAAADAACAALASAAIKDGQLSPATFTTLSDAEREEIIRTTKEHAKQSTEPAVPDHSVTTPRPDANRCAPA